VARPRPPPPPTPTPPPPPCHPPFHRSPITLHFLPTPASTPEAARGPPSCSRKNRDLPRLRAPQTSGSVGPKSRRSAYRPGQPRKWGDAAIVGPTRPANARETPASAGAVGGSAASQTRPRRAQPILSAQAAGTVGFNRRRGGAARMDYRWPEDGHRISHHPVEGPGFFVPALPLADGWRRRPPPDVAKDSSAVGGDLRRDQIESWAV